MSRKFDYDGKTFEIRASVLNDRYCVRVYLDGNQVSPEYSATLEVGHDFFSQHQQRIVDELAKVAESDVRNGIYFQV